MVAAAIPSPSPPEASVSADHEHDEEPSKSDLETVPKTSPKTVPGTCVVCFSNGEDGVLDADWLHQELLPAVAVSVLGEGKGKGEGVGAGAASISAGRTTGCPAASCVSCLKTYFEVISRFILCNVMVYARCMSMLYKPLCICCSQSTEQTLLVLDCAFASYSWFRLC